MHDQAYVNRKHQCISVFGVIGEAGFTIKELRTDIRLSGINFGTVRKYVEDFCKDGSLRKEPIASVGRGRKPFRYFANNTSGQNGYHPTYKTGGDTVRKEKMLFDAAINDDGSLSTKRVNVDGSSSSGNDNYRHYFQNEEQVLGMIEFLICNIENFTYTDELNIDPNVIPKSPIGTDSSFWKSKKTTAKIGSVTPKDIDRKTGYPQLAKTDKRGKK